MNNLDEVEKFLSQTWELLKSYERRSVDQPILKTNRPAEVKQQLDTNFPSGNLAFEELLKEFEQQILPYLNLNTDARYGAYITGSGNRVSALAEFIKGYYNQNALKWNNSPIASELELLVVSWIAEFVGLSDFSEGFLTSGGSMSNLMCLHLALAHRYPDREMTGLSHAPSFTVYCSDQTHSSIDRAMVFLGLGRNNLRKIEVNDQFQININELESAIKQDIKDGKTPFALVGNAGTTNTGSVDPLMDLAGLASQYDLWYHVDGAYGLPARRQPELHELFAGVEKADSVIINPHKWMYVTFEASCVLLRHIPTAIHFIPDYLISSGQDRWESSKHSIELSKEFKALKIWFTLKYYGASQLTDFIKKDIEQIQLLASYLEKIDNVIIEQMHILSILCFRWYDPALTSEENDQVNVRAVRMIEDEGRIFITGTRLRETTYLRVYFGNPGRRNSDVQKMAGEITRVFTNVVASINTN